jgi:hypothetical protein
LQAYGTSLGLSIEFDEHLFSEGSGHFMVDFKEPQDFCRRIYGPHEALFDLTMKKPGVETPGNHRIKAVGS